MKLKCNFKRFVLMSVVFTMIIARCSQTQLKTTDRHFSFHIVSENLDETRDVFIHLPDGYEKSDKMYPVLYVLDGESVFNFAVGAVDFLSISKMPETIVVGIPNTHRERDLWVNLEPDGGYIKFVDFLDKELIPYIDANFRTRPYRIFYGFCSGAGTCFWIFFTRPDMFEGYIASGTGFNQTWYNFGEEAFERRGSWKKSFFAVTEGTTPRAEGIPLLRRLFESRAPHDLDWDCRVMEDEPHGPVLAKGLFAGLEFIFRDWEIPVEIAGEGPSAVRKYYDRISVKYGWPFSIPERPVINAGVSLMWQGKFKEAIETLQFITKIYPESPDAFEALGVAYEENNQLDLGEKAYKTAFRYAKVRRDRRLPMFEAYLQRK